MADRLNAVLSAGQEEEKKRKQQKEMAEYKERLRIRKGLESMNIFDFKDKFEDTIASAGVRPGRTMEGDLLMLDELCRKTLGMRSKDEILYTALNWAVSRMWKEGIAVLLSYNAVPDSETLYRAVSNGMKDVIFDLLAKGAVADERSLEYARRANARWSRPDIVAALENSTKAEEPSENKEMFVAPENKNMFVDELWTAIGRKHTDQTRALVRKAKERGWTDVATDALQRAAELNWPEGMDIMMDEGAMPNYWTLYQAVKHKMDEQMLRRILRSGVKADDGVLNLASNVRYPFPDSESIKDLLTRSKQGMDI